MKKDRDLKRLIITGFFGLVFVVSAIALIVQVYLRNHNEKAYEDLRKEAKVEKADPKVKKKIDFKALKEQNADIYAWLNVPNTSIDYPVLMSNQEEDTDYYLLHNLDHSDGRPGCLYVQKEQSKGFEDNFCTIIYGHNMYNNGTMFFDLTKFQDENFFNENDTFTIETEQKRYTYKIYAASVHDDNHLLYFYNMRHEDGRTQFINDISSVSDQYSHVRSDMKIDVKKDTLVTLSTCMTRDSTHRYLVVGVLQDVKDVE